jgi:hypothetical protein
MAVARAFARYLAPMHRYAAADNRRTRHLILPGVRSRAALAPGPSDTIVEECHDSRAVLEGTRRAHDAICHVDRRRPACRFERSRSWTGDSGASHGLLSGFFLVVGLEIKREFTVGRLATRRSAALPIVSLQQPSKKTELGRGMLVEPEKFLNCWRLSKMGFWGYTWAQGYIMPKLERSQWLDWRGNGLLHAPCA